MTAAGGARRRGSPVRIAVVVLLLVISVASAYFVSRALTGDTESPYAQIEAPSASTISSIENDLNAGGKRLLGALDPVVAQAVLKSGERVLPAEAKVDLDPDSISADGRLASVEATVQLPNGDPSEWVVYLVYSEPNWSIYSTAQVQ